MIEFHFGQPFAREALELLSARKRGAGDICLLDDDHVFRHALDLCREKPSVIFREAAVILLELFDLPNLACWRASRPLALTILSAWRPQYARLFEREMIHLENLLTSRGLLDDREEIGSAYAEIASFRESHPLAAMHLQSAYVRRAGKKIVHERDITPAWRRYGLACHEAYRRAERYYVENAARFDAAIVRRHLYEAGLSLRYFLQFLPVVPGTGAPPDDEDITRAMTNLADCWRDEEQNEAWPERVAFHARNLRALFERWERRQRKRGPGETCTAPVAEEAAETPLTHAWDEELERGQGTWAPLEAQCIAFAAHPDEEAEATSVSPFEDAVDQIALRRGYALDSRSRAVAARVAAQRLHRDAIFFPYDVGCLQLHDYAGLYRACYSRPIEELPAADQAAVLAIVLAVHLGRGFEQTDGRGLLALELAPAEGAGGVLPALDPSGDALWLPAPPVGYAREPAIEIDWEVMRPTAPIFRLELPRFLARLARAYLATRAARVRPTLHRVFLKFGEDSDEPPRALTMTDLATYVETRGERPALVSRIARSFFPFYVSRLGLDPILASCVRGAAPRVFSTQMFYTHVDTQRLNHEWRRRAVQAHRLIATASGTTAVTGGEVPTPAGARPDGPGGIGSRITPRTEWLRHALSAADSVLAAAEPERDEGHRVLYHNVFVNVLWAVVSIVTGLRPRRGPACEAILEAAHPTRLWIADKQSPAHLEFRTQRRLPVLEVLRDEARRASADAHALPSFDGDRWDALGRPMIFHLRYSGEPEHPNPRRVREVFACVARLARAFATPLNVGRHLLETMLNEARADRDAVDYAVGHQRRWREALHRFSCADLDALEARFAEGVAAVFAELEVTVPRYRPASRKLGRAR